MSRPALPTVAEWLKPTTGVLPMGASGCGVVATGAAVTDRRGLLALQLALLLRFLASPCERATWYGALGSNFFVIGMPVSALALRAVANAA